MAKAIRKYQYKNKKGRWNTYKQDETYDFPYTYGRWQREKDFVKKDGYYKVLVKTKNSRSGLSKSVDKVYYYETPNKRWVYSDIKQCRKKK